MYSLTFLKLLKNLKENTSDNVTIIILHQANVSVKRKIEIFYISNEIYSKYLITSKNIVETFDQLSRH